MRLYKAVGPRIIVGKGFIQVFLIILFLVTHIVYQRYATAHQFIFNGLYQLQDAIALAVHQLRHVNIARACLGAKRKETFLQRQAIPTQHATARGATA